MSEYVVCPTCDNPNLPSSSVCGECGERLTPRPAELSPHTFVGVDRDPFVQATTRMLDTVSEALRFRPRSNVIPLRKEQR